MMTAGCSDPRTVTRTVTRRVKEVYQGSARQRMLAGELPSDIACGALEKFRKKVGDTSSALIAAQAIERLEPLEIVDLRCRVNPECECTERRHTRI